MIPPIDPSLLTTADKEALDRMPNGVWFNTDTLWPRVHRADYRCNRLHLMGYLEYDVIGTYPNLESRYRKKAVADQKEGENDGD